MNPKPALFAAFLLAVLPGTAHAEEATRGLGIYPGDPAEDFAPTLVNASPERRNLALHRATTQSSAYDYNLVAQLVTDGIKVDAVPRWFAVSTAAGELPSHTRAFIFDDNRFSGIELGEPGWIDLELGGGAEPFEVDRIEIALRQKNWQSLAFPGAFGIPGTPPGGCAPLELFAAEPPPGAVNEIDGNVEWSLLTSENGRVWEEIGHASAEVLPVDSSPTFENGFKDFIDWNRDGNPTLKTAITLGTPQKARRYRLRLEDMDCKDWQVIEARFWKGDDPIRIGGPYNFGSAWRTTGLGDEWLAVDLGATARVESVVLHWLRHAAEGVIQVSNDGQEWKKVAELSGNGGAEEIQLNAPVEARHVRVLMTRPSTPDGYSLSELEVFGTGGLVPRPKPQPAPQNDGSLHLAGGNWRLQRDSLASGDGSAISVSGYDDSAWIPATVPGTVLASYYNVGALADLNFGDNELTISDAFFHADFWYRNTFSGPKLAQGQRAFIELDGVNWKAEVYFNGQKLGRVEGAFMRGRFDVTEHLRPGDENVLAVRIEKPASPGATKQHTLELAGLNGGALGGDNPSYHASIGWDWIPTIRGRNIGLWNDVHLKVKGAVTIDDPFIRYELPLPQTNTADLLLDVTLTNHNDNEFQGKLKGTFGDLAFEQDVNLAASSTTTLKLNPTTHPQLKLREPKLWWPNGHGEPHLYDVEITLTNDNGVSDQILFQSGVRQMTFDGVEDNALRIFINGKRVVPRGGNWGFSEANLRYRGREYETAMRYHRDMNFTMVRNWVGQTGDNEFYEAAARNGLLVWQDFWLANPYDGPDPNDEALFMSNARDTIRRIRNYPSVGVYCGRNEGDPPASLTKALTESIAELHPEMHFIPNSQFSAVSGGGPYGVRSREYYFEERATPQPHSELGMTSVVTLESLKRMMPEAALWPMSLHWGLHDFNLDSNQKARDYVDLILEGYGGADNLEDWVGLAQLINYDGYRAMFEAQSKHRMGLQLWMSHPAWPSLTWQTYDYYFTPHAAFYGSKKGSEPLHIQWNPLNDDVEVVNYGVPDQSDLTAEAEILNLDGSVAWTQKATVESTYDSNVVPFAVEYPEEVTPVHFIRLRLTSGSDLISENFYWRGTEAHNYRALQTLPKVNVTVRTSQKREGERYVMETVLENPSDSPALSVRVVVQRSETGDSILPVHHSDNFVPLMPGEKRKIRSEVLVRDARGEEPRIVVEGFNVEVSE